MPTKSKKHASARQMEKAIELLMKTDMSYRQIQQRTGVSTSKLSTLGQKYRSEEKRQRLMQEGRRLGHQRNREKFQRERMETEVLPTATPEFQQPDLKEVINEPEGSIKRSIAFKYSSEGKDIKIAEFIEELHGLIETLEESENVLVDFSFTVQAE